MLNETFSVIFKHRDLTEILAYMQNVLVPASNWEILWNSNDISSFFCSVVRQEGRSSSDRKAFFSGLKKGVWETEIVWYREIPCSTKRRCKKRCWRQALSFLSDNPRHHHYKEKEDARDCSHKSRNIFVKNIFNNRVHMFTFFVDLLLP